MESSEMMERSNSTLRRRNSISTSVVVPPKLSLPNKPQHATSFPTGAAVTSASNSTSSSSSRSFPAVDFELISIKPLAYTSLKDLLPPTAVKSPTAARPSCVGGGLSSYEICIRNRLVKQAAWAYLQPMYTSEDSGWRHFLHRLWARISGDLMNSPIAAYLRSVTRAMTRAFDWVLRAIWCWR